MQALAQRASTLQGVAAVNSRAAIWRWVAPRTPALDLATTHCARRGFANDGMNRDR
jgi:hypothetical protein